MQKKKHRVLKFIVLFVFVVCAGALLVRRGGPPLLRAYVEAGLGNCHQQAIFCIAPHEEVSSAAVDTASKPI